MRTFQDFSRSASSRWATHGLLGRKPLSEFLGPELDEISFRMRFDVQQGMNPKQEMDRLLEMCRSGVAETLIIGGIALGMDQWIVKSVKQGWTLVDGAGRLLVGEADVTLEEYMRR
ncbi:phage tail protein [Brevibacillus ruminantium]|uniref:Phage tail protein n=1 Tax=Brevibacillus ruminantium TaxID=2950604 RepID=A0ABY4WUW8_9BACL|nr:phage tail protein [Brevibacillus ruminantium]USG68381.1 phage tail protein [Brevibacillus ruminantium]